MRGISDEFPAGLFKAVQTRGVADQQQPLFAPVGHNMHREVGVTYEGRRQFQQVFIVAFLQIVDKFRLAYQVDDTLPNIQWHTQSQQPTRRFI